MQSENGILLLFYIHISRLMQSENDISQSTDQKTASLYTYQSTYAIRKRHIIAVLYTVHISRLMQSANVILLLFYIPISKPWKWKKRGRVYKGGMMCPVHKHAPVHKTSTTDFDFMCV
jgi:hypothetical protein